MGISTRDRKILWTRAHNMCAFHKCSQRLVVSAQDSSAMTVIGEEAHIRSSKPSGPRHDPDYDPDKLDTYENLILLCPTHHTTIDANNGAGFSVEKLESMRAQHEQRQDLERIDSVVLAYLGVQFNRDDEVLFEQVDLAGPRVDAMFVDVPMSCQPDSPPADLMREVAREHPGDLRRLRDGSQQIVTGAAQVLLHARWSNHGLIVGGPGQGKSTLLQYVCQFHRSRLLGKSDYTGLDHNLIELIKTPRVALRIDLRDYAFWAEKTSKASAKLKPKRRGERRQQRSAPAWPTIEEYLVRDVQDRTGRREFDLEDLATVVTTRAVLLALDGLDEVADLAQREQVGNQIVDLQGRLDAVALDLVILVASRPGAATSRLWSSPYFPQLGLLRLTHGLQLQYLRKWASVAGLKEPAVAKLEQTFIDNENVPHFRELAAYPMQLAILLHLLQRKQFLPQQRTELYSEYLKTFLDRERGTDKEPLLHRDRQLLEDIHARIAWHIHSEAERGRSSGSIATADLRRIVREHVADRDESGKLGKQVLAAITGRVLCLVERDEGRYQFEVASLREYFAARYLFDEVDRACRDDCLTAVLQRPYWSNVCRFLVGMYTKGEVRGIRALLQELRGDSDLNAHPLLRATAVQLLNDGVYEGQPARCIQEIVDFALEGPGILLAADGLLDNTGLPFTLPEGAGRAQVVTHCRQRLAGSADASGLDSATRKAVALAMARHSEEPGSLRSWWWETFQPNREWLDVAVAVTGFEGLDSSREARLAHLLPRAVDATTWATDLLYWGGYDGRRDELLSIVKAEINEGSWHALVESHGRVPGTPVATMLASAEAFRLGHTDIADHHRARVRERRSPGAEIFVNLRRETASLEPPDRGEGGHGAWLRALQTTADAWGEGWVLRQAIAAAPASAELDRIARQTEADRPDLSVATRWESTARAHARDTPWWRENLLEATSTHMKMHWAFSLVARANPGVITQLAAELSGVVDGLQAKHFEALARAQSEYQKLPVSRILFIEEELRRSRGGHQPFSGRALWLIRKVASESSHDRLDRLLAPHQADLARDVPLEMVALVRLNGSPVELMRGARNRFPFASLPSLGPSAVSADADAILRHPAGWPAAATSLAADALETRMTQRLQPMEVVAEEGHWFSE